jgi:hypothetical protein
MVRPYPRIHSRHRSGLSRSAHFAGLLILLVCVSTVLSQCMAIDAEGKRGPVTLEQSYKPAFQFQSRMEKQAQQHEQDGGDGMVYRDILRVRLRLTAEQFAFFRETAFRFAREEVEIDTRIDELSAADRVQHPQARELSDAAKMRARDLMSEMDKALVQEVNVLRQTLEPTTREQLDEAVMTFCRESEGTPVRR